MDEFIFILELIGTVAFASSAAGGVFASGLCSCGGADIDDSFCDRICETDGF